MKVSLLCFDLNSHALVRAYPMAKALARRHEIEVIGPLFGNADVYEPYRKELPYKPIRLPAGLSPAGFVRYLPRWLGAFRGDVLYAFKPALCSLGAALWLRRRTGAPLLLDIEDWDAAEFCAIPWSARVRSLWTGLRHLASPQTFGMMEHLVGAANHRVVASQFLESRFGGTRIVHGADCSVFDPERFNAAQLRRELGLRPDWKIVLFAGTLLAHKGADELLEAVMRASRANLRLLVLGRNTAESAKLAAEAPGVVIRIDPQPHHEMPKFLAAADLVVLPQRDTPYARAQLPGKVFEAMAMAKPIVATAVSDLPSILDKCGVVVPPNDPHALCRAIRQILDNEPFAAELGRNAREKCIEHYSWDRMEQQLDEVLCGLKLRANAA